MSKPRRGVLLVALADGTDIEIVQGDFILIIKRAANHT